MAINRSGPVTMHTYEVRWQSRDKVTKELRRMKVRKLWKKAGTWEFMHPWIECILPWETAADCIEQVLADTPPGSQVGGHVLLWPAKGGTSRSKIAVNRCRPHDRIAQKKSAMAARYRTAAARPLGQRAVDVQMACT